MKNTPRKRFSTLALKRGFVLYRNRGGETIITYHRPKNHNDLKRIGKELSISTKNVTIRLNGKQINSIKKVLQEVGEIK